MRKFYGHVTQSAEADHPNFLALGDAPVMHGGVGSDAFAKQRRSCGKIEVGWKAQNEVFIDDDTFVVAAVGHASEMLVRRGQGEDHGRAELLEASCALPAASP